MKNAKDNIESRLPKSDGMTVPEGYFADFAARMTASLPERPEIEQAETLRPVRLTTWQRIRPYVYMAAMFAGVWCMLKVFTMLSNQSPIPFESNPIVAEAFNNEAFVNEYVISDINEWDLYDDLMDDGINPDSFLDSIQSYDFMLPNGE